MLNNFRAQQRLNVQSIERQDHISLRLRHTRAGQAVKLRSIGSELNRMCSLSHLPSKTWIASYSNMTRSMKSKLLVVQPYKSRLLELKLIGSPPGNEPKLTDSHKLKLTDMPPNNKLKLPDTPRRDAIINWRIPKLGETDVTTTSNVSTRTMAWHV